MGTLTLDRFGRVRDQQKQRVYDAEDNAGLRATYSATARRLLDTEARLIPQRTHGTLLRDGKAVSPSVEDCQRYVDDLLRDPWVQRRWGQQVIVVHWKAGGNATCSYDRSIALPPWARNEFVILHEVAHFLNGLADGKPAHHGPEFAGVLLALVRHRMGAEAGKRLREGYREKRVRLSMAHVPAPTRPVVTAADRAERAKEREARLLLGSERRRAAVVVRRLVARPDAPLGAVGTKARRHAQDTARLVGGSPADTGLTLTDEVIERAAAVLRALVKAGEAGAAGSKPRERALAVARVLDRLAPQYRAGGRRMTYAATPARW